MAERHLEQTVDQLRASLVGELLVEDHHTDFKRQLDEGAKANKELAVDVASFAVDGGRLYIGVNEEDHPPSLHPVQIEGLAERIDQVARSRIRPPLHLRCHQIVEPEAPEKGYLVVVVPPSPDAPHQVDGRYRGRGDTTNRVLSDSEVRDLLARRARTASSADELLSVEIQRDPTLGSDLRQHAHLFAVAQPVHGDEDLLHRHVPDGDWRSWLRLQILEGPTVRGLPSSWSPDIGSATYISRRADGWTVHTPSTATNGGLETESPAREYNLLELEVREDGGLRLVCGRGSAAIEGIRVLFVELVAGLTWRVARAALTVAETAEYYGAWDLGLALTNMRGVQAYNKNWLRRASATAYSKDEYRRTSRVSYEQLAGDLKGVVTRLAEPLGRALSTPINLV